MTFATTAFVHRFITSLVFTGVIETAILILLLRFVFRTHTLRLSQMVFVGLFASFATIPYVWFVFPYVITWPWSTAIMYSETFAFIIEAILYRVVLKVSWRTAFLVSLVCNLASYLLGPYLRAHGLWFYW